MIESPKKVLFLLNNNNNETGIHFVLTNIYRSDRGSDNFK